MSSAAPDLTSPAQLAEYEEQLYKVGKLLALTPQDPELTKLQNDLQQLVELCRSLQVLQPPSVAQSTDPLAAVQQQHQQQQLQPAHQQQQSGRRVFAVWEDGQWYVARVEREHPPEAEGRLGTLEVLYLEYNHVVTVTEDQIRSYVPAPRDRLVPGANVRAVNPADGMMYPARLLGEGAALGTYVVEFRASRQQAEVPAYDLLIDEVADARERRAQEQREKMLQADAFEAPEYLKPRESDSKAQREVKKQKVRALKSEFKKRKLDDAGKQKQQSWLSFRSGLEKRKSKRVKTASIFATSEQGKVGVTGSGRGLTTFEPRKKQYVPADQRELPPPGFEEGHQQEGQE